MAFEISPGESGRISVAKRQEWRQGAQETFQRRRNTRAVAQRAGSGMRVESPFSVAEK